MPVATSFYPYEFSTKVELKADDPYDPTQEEVDLSWLVRPDASNEDVLTLDLARSDLEWRELRVKLTATLSSTEVKRILPSGATLQGDTTLLVSLNCAATKVRRVVVLDYVDEGQWSGSADLRKDTFRGLVELAARLVRKTGEFIEGGHDEYARERGFVIAEGRKLRLIVDPAIRSLKGLLSIFWEDFRVSKDPWRKAHDSSISYLDLSDRTPVLWLNERYQNFRAALHNTHVERGGDAVIRHLGKALVAQSAWIQLFTIAVAALQEEEDGSITWPMEEWKRYVLESLVQQLYPGMAQDEQLRRLYDMRTGEQAATLGAMLGTVAQEVVQTSALVRKAISAAESVSSD